MSAKFDWDQFEEIPQGSNQNKFDWESFEEVKAPVSRARSIASAPAKGLIKGFSDAASLSPSGSTGPLPRELEERIVEEVLPTQDRFAEQVLERGARLAPMVAAGPETIGLKIAQALGGALSGYAAKESGLGQFGQGLAEAAGTGLPGLFKAAGSKLGSVFKGSEAAVEKLPSGLTKPRAVDSQSAKRALISPKSQEKAIAGLDKEAVDIAKKTVETRAPLIKQIEKGVDLEGKFQKEFGDLQKAAEKYNPEINTESVNKLFSKTADKYRGIPKPHSDAIKIRREIDAWRKRPPDDLKNLLKVYRSNNQKQKNIFENARVKGTQKEYSEFLEEMNRAIRQSFENTLPEDSAWIKQFNQSNLDYSKYKQALKAKGLLQSVLEEVPSPSSIRSLADNVKKQKQLSLALGKEGAQEITQLSKDLKKATNAIREIPAKEISHWDRYLPLAIFIPGYGKIGGLTAIPKYVSLVRRAYGYMLTKPRARRAYHDALRALMSKNLPAYERAAAELKRALEEDED